MLALFQPASAVPLGSHNGGGSPLGRRAYCPAIGDRETRASSVAPVSAATGTTSANLVRPLSSGAGRDNVSGGFAPGLDAIMESP